MSLFRKEHIWNSQNKKREIKLIKPSRSYLSSIAHFYLHDLFYLFLIVLDGCAKNFKACEWRKQLQRERLFYDGRRGEMSDLRVTHCRQYATRLKWV